MIFDNIEKAIESFKKDCLHPFWLETIGEFRGGMCVERVLYDGIERWVEIHVDKFFLDPKIRVLSIDCKDPPSGYADYEMSNRKPKHQ